MTATTLTPTMDATGMDQRIATLLNEWSARPFQWGVTDCCQFARAAVWQLCGLPVDLPAYTSEREALRVLASHGGYAAMLQAAGLVPRERTAAARRGDVIVLTHTATHASTFAQALGVCTGMHTHTTGPTGLVAVERSAWAQCWGVAHA